MAFMREYEELGHMYPIQDQPGDPSQAYYIPHHAVLAKFRVVFNASAKTSNGVSLNDTQMAGPPIQDLLVNLIHRFRLQYIALTADVEKMFRQVRIDKRHRQWQQILWRETPTGPVRTYQLATVTYGTRSGTYLSVRAMQQCGRDNCFKLLDSERAGAALDCILHNFYIDDYLVSVPTLEEALQLGADVASVLEGGHFRLRKWRLNIIDVVSTLSGASDPVHLDLHLAETTILGLHWDPSADDLFYRVGLAGSKSITKRQALSDAAKLYDPTGMLAPVLLPAKLFTQKLWQAKLEWDALLPSELQYEWLTFRNELKQLEEIKIPRWLGMRPQAESHIYGFCDASTKAYAAVIYLCTKRNDGQPISQIVASKTGVAPLHSITIPRLELSAAHLLATLLGEIKGALRLEQISYRTVSALLHHHLWWHGPTSDNYPIARIHTLAPEEIVEMEGELKPVKSNVMQTTTLHTLQTRYSDGRQTIIIDLLDRFSNLGKLLRSTAYLMRFKKNHRHYRSNLHVSAAEMDIALYWHIHAEQGRFFQPEIASLRKALTIPSSSKLLALAPCTDDSTFSILRVGGRLDNAGVEDGIRHPILLPRESTLTKLIVWQMHTDTLHGGVQLMLHTIRQKYWILYALSLVKQCIHACTTCRRHKHIMMNQRMASLPKARVTPAPPFSVSGVDYCGPFNIRIGSKAIRTVKKTYAAIFVCMATKAVHIELAEDLSAEAFINIYTRFVNRRGLCTDLYSDNGTAFVGANRMMEEDLQAWHGEYAQQNLANKGIRWHFIPPGAPHHGGLWEAAVKSAKKHILRIVGTRSIYYDQLHTLLVHVEACLNSRPLVALHDTLDDKMALSPADFLIGRSIVAVAEKSTGEVPSNRLSYYRQLRQMQQHFWQQWHDEYLSTLQTRSKWHKNNDSIQLGDIVIIRHENLPATHWRRGRVVRLHPGTDGLVRVVTIKHATGECMRPIQKICRLLDHPELNRPAGKDVWDLVTLLIYRLIRYASIYRNI
ncbi:PREDICTED: uncharacterized protein LOC108369602 [Rhagoletis zephyria]|uniref:uncharacterized protein LOC108369602 n=1 Tax=Rhagoletis zephyria TaxID=28612 RepID=UPI0008119861|nr:PREDICTED: uncharacterized protein LOC108369602 [Rhagoletis zephyria]